MQECLIVKQESYTKAINLKIEQVVKHLETINN